MFIISQIFKILDKHIQQAVRSRLNGDISLKVIYEPTLTSTHASLITPVIPVPIVQAFGKKGVHARSAVGTSSLPLDMPVELEAIVEVQ